LPTDAAHNTTQPHLHVVPPYPGHRSDLLGKPQTETMALPALR